MDEKKLQHVLRFRTKCNAIVQNLEEIRTDTSCADDVLKREIDTVLSAIRETAFSQKGYVELMLTKTKNGLENKEQNCLLE